MKIILNVSTDENGTPRHRVVIDEKEMAFIQDLAECPEDAHIGRDLIDGYDIIKYIKMGWIAAKNDEEIEVEEKDDEEYE